MKCPHCLIEIFPNQRDGFIRNDISGGWYYEEILCPSCQNLTISLILIDHSGVSAHPSNIHPSKNPHLIKNRYQVYPKGTSRSPLPPEVEEKYKRDYTEACLVLESSPKASAALSRRCLQHLLRDTVKVKKDNLSNEIDEAIKISKYPTSISDLLDALRLIGNFSAHPEKDKSTGEIIEVEIGEAELCLEILEALFDYHFVLPARNKKRKDDLNQKLEAAGKNPIK